MDNSANMLIFVPVLGGLVLASLGTVGYLAWLEFVERRTQRRLEEKRARLSREHPYRPTTARRLAFQTTEEPMMASADCAKFRHAFPRLSRHAGWNFNSAFLN